MHSRLDRVGAVGPTSPGLTPTKSLFTLAEREKRMRQVGKIVMHPV